MLGQSGRYEPVQSLRISWSRYITHTPTAKQLAFLMLSCEEAFYGGSAGGGKSDALLMAALQYVDIPGYAALLLRRTYADLILPEALMDRARQWLSGTDAQWRDSEKTWRFPSGATLSFGYLDNENDVYRYQSSAFQFIGFDELTQFTESQYRYLFSRLRRLQGVDVPVRMRSASNPGGRGHEWVKQRFITEGIYHSRVFIPAALADNPFLDRESYVHSLDQLGVVLRAQLLNGDWTARNSGSMFRREWFKVVDAAPANCAWVRAWDMAATESTDTTDPDWSAGCLMGLSEGKYYIKDMRHLRGTPQIVEAQVKQAAQIDGKATAIVIEQEPGAGGKTMVAYYIRQLAGYKVVSVRAADSKSVRAAPVSSQAEAGNVYLVNGQWTGAFLDEVEGFPDGAHDDQVDAMAHAFAWLTAGQRQFMVG
jgi:predicted phage terminase large subunit-like protein